MTTYKSDDRPSDTKSVVLNKIQDRRLLDHLRTLKGQSESTFWRGAGNFYLDFMAWLASQPGAPEPDQPFIHYQAWLEQQRQAQPATLQASVDPESIAAAILPGVRAVIEAALATAGWGPGGADRLPDLEVLDFADQFSDELVLE